MLHVIIMAGGQGTRLWPESRKGRPKQFIPLKDGHPLIEVAAESLGDLVPREQTFVVTGQSMIPMVREAIPWLPERNILVEPVGRNTAPCIGLAAIHLLRDDPNATMIVLSADHWIEPRCVFSDTVRFAIDLVDESPERLVVMTVKPTYASTSYGYLERQREIDTLTCRKWSHLARAYAVAQFHEKPDQRTAEEYLRLQTYTWNAGIFVWKAQRIYDFIAKHQPELGLSLKRISNAMGTAAYQTILAQEYERMQSQSIDYAVLEKAHSLVCIDAPFRWEDIGSWQSLDRFFECQYDQSGNLISNARVIAVNSHHNHVRGVHPHQDIVLVGVDNLIIVQSDNGMLIADKSCEEAIRQAISELKPKSE
ncbi:MAG: mannose-1-phosphate guanylyltransferase [Planctomycetaceae bacterium]|nr:mannose-1-phosphate guanylyltransferase [Planctomycetaceae bacterium]